MAATLQEQPVKRVMAVFAHPDDPESPEDAPRHMEQFRVITFQR